jgi:WD40 repeat protein
MKSAGYRGAMKSAGAAVIIIAMLLPGIRAAAEGSQAPVSWAMVNSSHRGAVLDIAFDEARKLLVSVGEDGTLRVWNQSPPALVRSLAVTHLKAQMLALNPAQPQAAFVSTDGIGSFAIEAWDWEKGRQLYRIPLKEEPLFLRYAGAGETLLYGETRFGGPRIVNASDGTPAAMKSGTSGMAGFAELSRSGTTLMSYLLDGRIVYADTASGKIVQESSALPWLTNLRITGDKRYLLGRTNDELACLDLLSGYPVLSVTSIHLVSADISAAGDEIVGVSSDGTISLWTREGASWQKTSISRAAPWQPVLARFLSDGILLAGRHGEIDILKGPGSETPFARDLLSEVSGIAVSGSELALSDTEGIRLFDLSAEGGTAETLPVPRPFPGHISLLFLSPSELLAWNTDEEPGAIGILDLRRGTFRKVGGPGSASLLSVQAYAGRLYVLEKDGTVKVMAQSTGAVVTRVRVPGAVAISPLQNGDVAVGQGPESSLQGSLVRVSRTGETVALPTPNVYTYALRFDPGKGCLYSLGVDAEGYTNLLCSQGSGFPASTVIDRAPGESLSASLTLDQGQGVLYSTIGRDKVIAWNGAARTVLELSARAATALAADSGLLVALDRDSSVRLWDSSGRVDAQLSLFADGGWASVGSDGRVAGSANAAGRVSVFSGSSTTPVSAAPSSQEEARAP